MARSPRRDDLSGRCPICGKNFSKWFCPTCGVPLSTTHHLRPEYRYFDAYQLCAKCNTKNPYGARYCRNCREEIYLHAKDKNGHEWVDLGLSVLWSAEAIFGYYHWNHSKLMITRERDLLGPRDYREKVDGKDIATVQWGGKWRTPTKEEFEELINKCKWEKCILPPNDRYALKVTGPNGNSIFMPTTGLYGIVSDLTNENTSIHYWTSSSNPTRERYAYVFRFTDWCEALCGLTGIYGHRDYFISRKPQDREYLKQQAIKISKFVNLVKADKDFPKSSVLTTPIIRCCEEIITIVEQTKNFSVLQYRTIEPLRNELFKLMYDNRKALWTETPTILLNDNEIMSNIGAGVMCSGRSIRPVADKKWLGRL